VHILGELFTFKPKEFFGSSHHPVTWSEVGKEFINDNVKLNVFKGSKFIQTDYDEDKKKSFHTYNSKGYRDADVEYDTIYNFDNRSINIDLKLHEGPKYYFRTYHVVRAITCIAIKRLMEF
jgi:outer membrane protein insertion porin family